MTIHVEFGFNHLFTAACLIVNRQ